MTFWPVVAAIVCALTISPPASAADGERPLLLADRYRQALSIDPDNLPLHYHLGVALLFDGRDMEAIDEFRRAYSAFTDSIEMNYNLGLAYARTGDRDSALLYLDQAETLGALDTPELYPLTDAYFNLGLAALEEDSFDEAVRLFAKVLELEPDRHEIHRLLGDLYARRRQPERALEEFGAYLQTYPDDTASREYVYTLHFNRAQELLEAKDLAGARAAFGDALAAAPGSPLATYYLGYLDYLEGNLEQAATGLAQVYSAVTDEVRQSIDSILYNIALKLQQQRMLRQALAAMAPFIDRQTQDPKILYLAGNIHLALKEFERARSAFLGVLTLEPTHRGAIMNLVAAEAGAVEELFGQGRALFRQGAYPAALEKLEAALSINPADSRARTYAEESRAAIADAADGLFTRAETTLQEGDAEAALDQAREGLALLPDSARGVDLQQRALDGLARKLAAALAEGLRLEAEGELQQAALTYARIREKAPDNPQAQEGEERIERRLREEAGAAAERGTRALDEGRLAEAREAFTESLRLTPGLLQATEGLARTEALVAALISEERQWGRREQSAGRLQKAREHFANALRLRDDTAIREELAAVDRALAERTEALLQAGRRALAAGDFKRAKGLFAQVQTLAPRHPGASTALAEAEAGAAAAIGAKLAGAAEDLAGRNVRRALVRFREVLDIDPANAAALSGLDRGRKLLEGELSRLLTDGEAAMAKGLYGEAEATFREALALDPFRNEAQAALMRLEQLQHAGVTPGDEPRLYLQGIELYTQGKYEEAVTVWERVLILDPRHEKARMNIEKAQRKLRQIREYSNG